MSARILSFGDWLPFAAASVFLVSVLVMASRAGHVVDLGLGALDAEQPCVLRLLGLSCASRAMSAAVGDLPADLVDDRPGLRAEPGAFLGGPGVLVADPCLPRRRCTRRDCSSSGRRAAASFTASAYRGRARASVTKSCAVFSMLTLLDLVVDLFEAAGDVAMFSACGGANTFGTPREFVARHVWACVPTRRRCRRCLAASSV